MNGIDRSKTFKNSNSKNSLVFTMKINIERSYIQQER